MASRLRHVPWLIALCGLATGVALALSVHLVISTRDLSRRNNAAIQGIYEIRHDNCVQQNSRHDRTLAVLQALYSHGHASAHSEQATELVINALVPVRNCALIRRTF